MVDIGNIFLAEVMLWLMYIALGLAVVAVAVSTIHSLRMHSSSIASSNRVPRRRISIAVAIFTAVLLVVSCLFGSANPLVVNGTYFTDTFWLKVSDGLIVTSVAMMAVSALMVLYGVTGLNRHITRNR